MRAKLKMKKLNELESVLAKQPYVHHLGVFQVNHAFFTLIIYVAATNNKNELLQVICVPHKKKSKSCFAFKMIAELHRK